MRRKEKKSEMTGNPSYRRHRQRKAGRTTSRNETREIVCKNRDFDVFSR